MARLGDVFVLIRNGASIKQTDGAGGIPITRIETISNREVDRNKFGYAGIRDIQKYGDYILQDEDILMSHINSEKHLGKAAIYRAKENERIIHGMNLLMLRANFNMINPKYALYYFETQSFKQQVMQITKKSVNQASFTVTALKDIEIPLLSLGTQWNIVRVLDKVSDLISLRKQQLAKLDELVKARFVEMFEGKYSEVMIGDKFQTTSGGTPSKNRKEFYENATIPWLTSGEVNSGIIYSVKNYISEEGMNNSSAKIIPENAVVVAMYGATAGQVGLLRIRATTNQAVCSILPNQFYIPEYLYYAVKSKKDWMISQCAGGAQPNISQSIIKKMKIINAPIEVQKSFASFVVKMDDSKLTIQQSLDKLEVLKKSLMQEYFG